MDARFHDEARTTFDTFSPPAGAAVGQLVHFGQSRRKFITRWDLVSGQTDENTSFRNSKDERWNLGMNKWGKNQCSIVCHGLTGTIEFGHLGRALLLRENVGNVQGRVKD